MTTTDRETDIAHALLDLANRPADFDPLELLHDLTARIVALLPVQCAGITVMDRDSTGPAYVTASDERCLALEEEQCALNEGPCIDTARHQQPLPVTSLTEPPGSTRWPRFAPLAREAGITAVASVLLRLPHSPLGALNLLMAGPPHLSSQDLRLAQSLADATSTALAVRQQMADGNQVLDQLQTALDNRLIIEQAKGVLSVHLGVGMDEAFRQLRAYARARRQKLSVLSARVARGDLPADLITATT
ncbi:ANTAR domain-containing protein [Streptomyces sp. NPDC057302]|uniref:ANTAR domain-containing protein n=1 Tax=Streptomyces sp. NPDC057302 TaxID=3346094 RepID=UPI00363DA8F8